MDRRNFLQMMIGGVAAAAAERTFPFRVFSFPSEIKLAAPGIPIRRITQGFGDFEMQPEWDEYTVTESTLSRLQLMPFYVRRLERIETESRDYAANHA